MFENNIVIYKFVQDLHFFVTGGDYENELILATVLQAFFDSVGVLLRLLSYINYLSICCIQESYQSITIHRLVLDDFTAFSPPEAMWTRGKHLRTWISFYCALMKLLMAGMLYVIHMKFISFSCVFVSFSKIFSCSSLFLQTTSTNSKSYLIY